MEIRGIVEQLPKREEVALVLPTPATMLDLAIRQNLDADKLEKIMGLFERWEANEARKQFETAMTNFKAERFVIPKDKENKQYGSWYTSIEKMVEVVTPFLSAHKLFATWAVDQTSGIKVTCTLEGFGHSKYCSVTFPPDTSGKKNSLQEIKSAITYGKICTYESVCGLASEAGNLSDDGNAAGGKVDNLSERLEWIANARSNEELRRLYEQSYNFAEDLGDVRAMNAIIEAKNKKYKELNPKVRGA